MTVKHLGESYEFQSENREDRYGGDFNFYIQWHKHLMFACPSAYRAPVAMKMRDFMEQMFIPDYSQHPDTAKLDIENIEWQLDHNDWRPDLDKSFAENGVGHMSYLCIRSPGLEGMHGAGN
jgi:phenol hydroxylase P4 protein